VISGKKKGNQDAHGILDLHLTPCSIRARTNLRTQGTEDKFQKTLGRELRLWVRDRSCPGFEKETTRYRGEVRYLWVATLYRKRKIAEGRHLLASGHQASKDRGTLWLNPETSAMPGRRGGGRGQGKYDLMPRRRFSDCSRSRFQGQGVSLRGWEGLQAGQLKSRQSEMARIKGVGKRS